MPGRKKNVPLKFRCGRGIHQLHEGNEAKQANSPSQALQWSAQATATQPFPPSTLSLPKHEKHDDYPQDFGKEADGSASEKHNFEPKKVAGFIG